MPRNAIIIAFLLLLTSLSQAQYYFENLSVQDGLSDNRVTCFFKDHKGFMWIGTANGLNRYDGYSFRIYRPGQHKFRLSGEYITAVAQDGQNRLWIATRSGLNVLNVEKDSLKVFSPDSDAWRQKSESLASMLIWDVKIDRQERVWLACDNRDLCYYDLNTGKFIYKPWKKFATHLFPFAIDRYSAINKIYFRGDTALYLGTTLGLFSYNINTEEFHFLGGDQAHDFIALHEDAAAGKVYFTQGSGGYHTADISKISTPPSKNTTQWLPGVGALWQLTNGDPSATKQFAGNSFLPKDAGANIVYKDDHDISWIGSNRGVTRFDPRLNRFSFTSIFPATDSVDANAISNIYYSETDSTYYGVSYRYDKVFSWNMKHGYRELLTLPFHDPFMNFSSFYQDSHHTLWLLTHGGIYRYDRKKGKFIFFSDPSGKKGVLYTSMQQDANGDLWVGSYPDGLFHYSAKSADWVRSDTSGGFESRIITAIHYEKSTDQLWVGSFDYGLHRLDIKSNTWSSFGMELHSSIYMNSALITDISRDHFGNIWITTNAGGLSRFDGNDKTGEFCKTYSMESGLPDNTMHAVASDQRGNTWLSTYKGLTCIDSSGHVVKHFDNRNGLPYENYSSRLQVTRDGCIITAVSNGFIRFHPDSISYATDPFPVVITSCAVKDSSLANIDSLLQTHPHYSYRMNEWQFTFSALNFTNPAAIRYYYKLEGYDDHWIDAGATHTARYTNLDNGQYTFRVKALHPSGMYSANEAVFAFSIRPPFWKTWWFVLLVATAIVAIVYYIYRYQLNKKLEVERLRLRISRDLHDDIGSALTSINVLSKVALSKGGGNMEIGGYLSQIKNAASDTMESMSDIVWAINPQNDKLEAMTSRMKEFAAELCEAKQVELDFVLPKDAEKISLDAARRKNVFLIFKEAVNNAIKYSECTQLYIGIETESNRLHLEIRDNGKGFDTYKGKTGNGLKSMKERSELIGGQFAVFSKPGSGTSVKADIPVSG